MANFTYRVINKEGKEKKGAIEADTREKAMAELKSDGNTVLSLNTGSILNKEISFGKKKVKPRDLSVFCRQFNSLLRAGVSIVMSLGMLAEQTENKTLQQAIFNVRDGVQKGDSLASSMKKETVFPGLLVSMMEAGESSGNIESSLDRMAEHFERDTKIKALLKKTMMYPIILLTVAVGVLVVMLVTVIPKFANMFKDLDADLPGITKAMMGLSDVLKNYWYIFVIVIAALVFAFKAFGKSNTGKVLFSKLKLKLPVFGKLNQKTASARFARTFGTMLSSGMPMVQAMEITAKTMDNYLFKEALNNAVIQIQRGLPLSQILKSSGLFPPLIIHMVGIGEESGNLEEMLNNSARYYDEEVEMATQQVMALMEPMVIIVLAVIVCLILASIYGPIVTLYGSLG